MNSQPSDGSTYKANPHILHMWATRTKCWMCKHRFERPVILPVEKPQHGTFQPNVNVNVLWHMSDTHGLPADIVREWVIGSVYGADLGLFGIKGVAHDGFE